MLLFLRHRINHFHHARTLSSRNNVADLAILGALRNPIILDVRDPNEVAAGKGGPPSVIVGSVNVPLNQNGRPQSEHQTTLSEFQLKIAAAGVKLPLDKLHPIVTHCGSGGRGGRARDILKELGYKNVFNGGGPAHIASAFKNIS